MSGGKLEIQVGADKTDFDKKIKEVEFDIKELSKVKLDRLKLGLDTTEINKNIRSAKDSLNTLKATAENTGNAFSKSLTPKVANGGNALMQFSRIAQDAPFGIMGIGNNITATAEAFSSLKQQTGSTGGALKALGQSLMGSGGILLGVSLLTTGLTLLSQSGLSLSDVLDKLTGNANAYGNALKKATTGAFTNENVIQAVEDVKQLTNEVELAKDGFLNKDKVVEHYNETMGKTTGIVKTLDEVEQQLVKNGQAYIQMMLFKTVATLAQAEAAKELLNREKVSKSANSDNIGVLGTLLALTGTYGATIQAVSIGEKNRKDAINNSTKAMNANLAVAEKYNKLAAQIAKNQGFNFFSDNETVKTPKAKKEVDLKFKFKQDPTIQKEINTFLSELQFKYTSPLLQLDIVPDDAAIKAAARLKEIENALLVFNENINSIIQDSIASTFAGLGQSIGDALANGGNVLKAVGNSLLSSLGSLLTDMGKMAIQVGVGLIAIKLALKSLNPAIAIAAGVALVALGSFFSSKSSSIGGGIGGGGGASGASGNGASNSSFSSSGFSSRGDGGGTVVFEIAGQKLIGVLSNTLNGNRRLGGSLGL